MHLAAESHVDRSIDGPAEFIGSGYTQLIGPLVPAKVNLANQNIGLSVYEKLLGFQPKIALVNEQAYSAGLISIYRNVGYQAIIMEWDNPASAHQKWDVNWFKPTYCFYCTQCFLKQQIAHS